MRPNEAAAALMLHLCEHWFHGYSQISRFGDGEGVCEVEVGGRTYYLEQGDRDCSSAVISCYEAVGVDCGGATYTGDMRACMTAAGNFEWMPMSYVAQPGDIYLNEASHTAMCVSASPDMLAEFYISENGTIDGAEGDQTGNESRVVPYYDFPWDGILRYVGDGVEGDGDMTPEQAEKLDYIYNELKRTDAAGWGNAEGHTMFGRINRIEHQLYRTDAEGHEVARGHDVLGIGGLVLECVRDIRKMLAEALGKRV